MKKRKLGLIATLCFVTTFVTAITVTSATVNAATITTDSAVKISGSETYSWNKAKTGGGGGYIPAIIFNQSEKDLIYVRTDMGGIYRWNPSNKTWTGLSDWIGLDDYNLLGCESLASDPVDPNRVYATAGTYTQKWSTNGAILKSTDKGDSWEIIRMPFKMGGNMPGRSMGERLAIDPNDNSILYLGTHNGNGLWKSTDYGSTWAKVEGFTATGDYTDSWSGDQIGVVWVTFDKSTGSSGSASQTIYVGVADTTNSIYKSTDGGKTWATVEGQPNKQNQSSWVASPTDSTPTGYLPQHGVISSDGYLYVSYSSTCGPYNSSKGDAWKYNTKTGEWTNIAPVKPSDNSNNFCGYGGIAVDPQDPQTIMLSNFSWYPDVQIYRSKDGGQTWNTLWSWEGYPTRKYNYNMDVSKAPWLDFGGNPNYPEVAPKLGWMVGGIFIDPFNSDRVMYGTGATLFASDNMTDLDKGKKVNIFSEADGIEETAVSTVLSPSTGANLISGMYDVGGFVHDDLTKAPKKMLLTPLLSTTSMDFAELKQNFVVRSGNDKNGVVACAFSYNGGKDWFTGKSISDIGSNSGGYVAASADATSVVWSPTTGTISYSTNNGSAWTACTGIPSGAKVASDRVNPKVFYGYLKGKFYVSEDGGATFEATAATGMTDIPTESQPGDFKALPGKEGEIWLTGTGMWHSTDYGKTFVKVDGIDVSRTIGYGKAAEGSDYPAMYTNSKINGVNGIYRSINEGKTWVRINDDKHQYGVANEDISGDPRIYGRVYIATNGLGVVYGDATSKEPIPLSGDANNDGEVDILDYIEVQNHILDGSTDINIKNSDLNGDLKINTSDLLALRKIIVE